MAENTKTYFLAPTRDCPPSGPIALGSIITSPFSPELALKPPLPIDQALMPISIRSEHNWKLELSKHRKGRIGLWTSFLQIIGPSADLSVGYEQNTHSFFEFQRLDTYTFWPSKAYVQESVTAPEVQAFLAQKMFRSNVYMITGISVAVGAAVSQNTLRRRGVYVHTGVDGTAAGIPVSAGPQADVEWGRQLAASSQGGSDYVFAFRLREICYTTKRGVLEREFTKGALFGLDDLRERGSPSDGKRKELGASELRFELLGLAEEDVRGEDIGGDAMEVEDEDGEKCECVALEL